VLLNIVFAVGFASVFAYLALFLRFARRFPQRYPEMWRSLGGPGTFGLHGQATYLAVILGLERNAPREALQNVWREVMALRALLGVCVVAFVSAAFMTS